MHQEARQTGGRVDEPSVQPTPSRLEERLFTLFERAESALMALVALILVILALLAVLDTAVQVGQPLLQHDPDFTRAVTSGIDTTFLVIILLELLNTSLSRGPVSSQLQEFLIIGITVAVRHSLELVVGKGSSRELVIDFTINAAGALILAVALWLVRQPLPARRGTRRSTDAADQQDTAPAWRLSRVGVQARAWVLE